MVRFKAVFHHGQLLAVHSSVKVGSGAGGSAAARLSIESEKTREHVEKLGQFFTMAWCFNFRFYTYRRSFYYIECNPRMVEPANAYKAGVNFPKIMIG